MCLYSFLGLQVVAASGAVSHDELVKTVEKSFQNLPADTTTAGHLVEQDPAIFTGSEVCNLVQVCYEQTNYILWNRLSARGHLCVSIPLWVSPC